jgi:hypothetical protein
MALRIMQSEEIESFDEDSTTARAVKMYYFNIFSNCLCQYQWSFSLKQELLQQLSSCPLPQYRCAYKLPIDALTIVSVGSEYDCAAGCMCGNRYEIFSGDVLCTDMGSPLFIRYTYAPPVAYLPSYFIDYLIHAIVEEMSAVFGYNMEGQKVFHERIYGKCGKLGYAIRRDQEFNKPRQHHCDGISISRAW